MGLQQLPSPPGGLTDLLLNEHGHVEEHVAQLGDALLQLHDVIVPRLDVLE